MTCTKMTYFPITVLFTGFGACATLAQPAAPVTNPPPQWVSSAALGLTLTRGNSDTTTLSLGANTEKKWAANDLSLGADGLYGGTRFSGASSSKENADLLHGFVQYNRSFSDKFYAYGRVDGLHDGIADIQYRLTVSPGIGYYFVKEKNTNVSIEIGPGWVDEKLGNTYRELCRPARGSETPPDTQRPLPHLGDTRMAAPGGQTQ